MDYKPLLKNEYQGGNWAHPEDLADPYELFYRRYGVPDLQYGLQTVPPAHFYYDQHPFLRALPLYDPVAEKEILLAYYKMADVMHHSQMGLQDRIKYLDPCSQQEFCQSREASNLYMAPQPMYDEQAHSHQDEANPASDQDCQLIKAEEVAGPALECWIAPESMEEVLPLPRRPVEGYSRPYIGGITPEERQAKINLYR